MSIQSSINNLIFQTGVISNLAKDKKEEASKKPTSGEKPQIKYNDSDRNIDLLLAERGTKSAMDKIKAKRIQQENVRTPNKNLHNPFAEKKHPIGGNE